MVTIERIDSSSFAAQREALIDLLIDTVENGSSVGFVLPLSREEAGRYWDDLLPSITQCSRLLWLARDATGALGTVQLELVMKKNGVNRAEVQKLLVHSTARRRGVARARLACVRWRRNHCRFGEARFKRASKRARPRQDTCGAHAGAGLRRAVAQSCARGDTGGGLALLIFAAAEIGSDGSERAPLATGATLTHGLGRLA